MNLPGYKEELTACIATLLNSYTGESVLTKDGAIFVENIRIVSRLIEGEGGSTVLRFRLYDGGSKEHEADLFFDRSSESDRPVIFLSYPDNDLVPFAPYYSSYLSDYIHIDWERAGEPHFIILLCEELLFCLAWSSMPLYLYLKKQSSVDYLFRLDAHIRRREFIHALYRAGFKVDEGRIYCKRTGKEHPFIPLPEEGTAILLKSDDEEPELEGIYDHGTHEFMIAAEPAANYCHFWRYKEDSEMETLLESSRLGDYKEFILQKR